MSFLAYLIKQNYSSVKEFATECGVTRCTMYHYITGFRFPNTDNFMTIAEKLNISAEELYRNWYREVKEND